MRPRDPKAPVLMPPLLRPTDPAYTLERYDPRQAAAYLGRSRAKVYRDIANGQLAHRRDGKRGVVRMSQADLDAWREARRREVVPTSEQRRGALKKAVGEHDGLDLPRKLMFRQ